ncbi:MAG: hypothetical protein ACXVBC_13960, partial [Bdellovibrionota bacterium]
MLASLGLFAHQAGATECKVEDKIADELVKIETQKAALEAYEPWEIEAAQKLVDDEYADTLEQAL